MPKEVSKEPSPPQEADKVEESFLPMAASFQANLNKDDRNENLR